MDKRGGRPGLGPVPQGCDMQPMQHISSVTKMKGEGGLAEPNQHLHSMASDVETASINEGKGAWIPTAVGPPLAFQPRSLRLL